jgi:serine/threonine protein kinase
MDLFETFSPIYSATQPFSSVKYGSKSSGVPGASLHSAIYSRPSTTLEDNLISFLSYVKSQNIPILPVSLPDVRSVLGQGASFFVNGAEMPETYTDEVTGTVLPKGLVVAFKRATMSENMTDIIADRINIIFNEVLTMLHPPLLAHPNIVRLLGIGFELEGMDHVMPVLIPECAELGNLAEVLETARKEDRPLDFEEKLSLCIDVAHGLEVLHACGRSPATLTLLSFR